MNFEGRYLPAAVTLIGIIVTISAWQILTRNQYKLLNHSIANEAESIANLVEHDLNARILSLDRMAARWEKNENISREQWVDDALNYYSDYPGYQAIEWVDSNFYVRWIGPLDGNEQALNLNLGFEENRRKALLAARDLDHPTISKPITLVQGGKGFLVYNPIRIKGSFHGFILGVFRFQQWIESILAENVIERFSVQIQYAGDLMVDVTGADAEYLKEYMQAAVINKKGADWKLLIKPTETYVKEENEIWPYLILVFGTILSLLLGFSVFAALSARKAQVMLKEANNSLELKVQERTKSLENINRELEQFNYVASHDLKAPIINLDTILNLAESNNKKEGQYKILMNKAQESVQVMKKKINSLNEVLDAKKSLHLEPRKIRFDEVLNTVLKQIDNQLKESNAKIKSNFSKSEWVDFPPIHLRHILQNLITNAIKFCKPGRTPEIEVSSCKDNGMICLCVKDNGQGLDLNKYGHKLFGLFQRFHLDSKGNGIGLHITKQVVENYGGHIKVESTLGDGATFKIYFAQ